MVHVLAIGMFEPSEVPGGMDGYRVGLERALTELGHVVTSVAAAERRRSPGSFRPGPAGPAGMIWGVARTTCGILRAARGGVDMVASHFALTGTGAWLCPQTHGRPWVVHFHGPWAREVATEEGRAAAAGGVAYRARAAMERALYRRARAVITLSRAFAYTVVDEYGVPGARVFTIPPGVDLSRFCPGDRSAARRRFGLRERGLVLLSIRRLVRRMGLETLVEAAARVPPGGWQLLIAGDGSERAALESLVRRRGLAGRVRLLGRVPDGDLPALYRAADVFVLPSEQLEGFGMVVPEALACGVPVLATPVGGIPEAVVGLDGALLPKAGDIDSMADTVLAVIEGRYRLPDSRTARRYAEQRFSWTRAAEQVSAVYREACAL